jgi:hypothetical protein
VLFAHDTEVALSAAAALVNTAQVEDELATMAALDEFVQAPSWTPSGRCGLACVGSGTSTRTPRSRS